MFLEELLENLVTFLKKPFVLVAVLIFFLILLNSVTSGSDHGQGS